MDDVLLLKLDPGGTRVIYTRRAGGRMHEHVTRMVVGIDGSVVLGGLTFFPDFPTTPSAWQESLNVQSARFVMAFDPAGEILYSTLIHGGTPDAMVVNSAGEAILTGRYSDSSQLGEVTRDVQPPPGE